jgi:hypothetical protein
MLGKGLVCVYTNPSGGHNQSSLLLKCFSCFTIAISMEYNNAPYPSPALPGQPPESDLNLFASFPQKLGSLLMV